MCMFIDKNRAHKQRIADRICVCMCVCVCLCVVCVVYVVCVLCVECTVTLIQGQSQSCSLRAVVCCEHEFRCACACEAVLFHARGC